MISSAKQPSERLFREQGRRGDPGPAVTRCQISKTSITDIGRGVYPPIGIAVFCPNPYT